MPTVYLSPDPINSTQLIPGGVIPAAGGKLFHYLAGSSTKTDVYTDITGLVKWANPIVLDSGGNLGGSNEVWIPAGVTVKFVLAPFNDTDPPIAPYKTWDNLSGINDPTSLLTEWVVGPTPTFVSTTSFTLVGDQTAIFTPGRRVKTTNTAGTRYGTISTSVFGALTTVTIANDSGTLDAGLSAVWYALINPINTSLPLIVSVLNFGAKGDGVTDDTAAILAFLAAAVGKLGYMPKGVYNFNPVAGITTLGCALYGDGIQQTIISITGNGDLFQCSGYSVLRDLTIDMNGGTYSGHACKIAASSLSQKHLDIEIREVASTKQAILFEADGGSGFSSYGCSYNTLSAVGTAAAIKVNGNDSTAIPRKFYGTDSGGCTLFDFGGALDFFASGFFTNGMIFGANSGIVQLNNFRNGSTGGTLTINGAQHVLSGISATAMAVACTDSIINVQTPSWAITETGTGNHLEIGINSYTPVWDQASGTQPALGDGTLTGKYSRHGDVCHVFIILTAGASTTFGNNAVGYRFSVPFPANSSFTHRALPCRVCDVSVPTDFTVWGSFGGGQSFITLGYNNGAVRSDNPIAVPATGDVWQLSFSYQVA